MNHSVLVRPPHTATLLHIALFGPPQLTWDEQPIALPRRQLRALLYRLAATLQPVSRDQLCFLFWPDSPETVARRNLTVLLNQLRNLLPAPDLLVAQRDVVALDPARVRVDTVALADALIPQRQHHFDALSAAVGLYRGQFLDGFALPGSVEFDEWADRERHIWERRYLDALALLIDGYAQRGAYAEAIEAAQRALAVDALAEEMHRRLIVLYAELGDRTAALRQFEHCAEVLERELGVSPLPETRAVYEAVRDGLLPRQLTAAHSASAAKEKSSRLRHLPAAPTPLIGRAEECAHAIGLLRDPAVRLLTLCGPGGSGKTRLALHLAWEIAERFADGVVFVPLAALHDGALLAHTIAHACGLKPGQSQDVREYLRDKELLLVLDNCEHLPDLQAEVARLLAAAPGLRVLTTSRAALNLQGEHIFPVSPLPLPDLSALPSPATLAEVPSLALLLARTQALNPRFELTAENAPDLAAICVRLDGLPLAIELAAARLKLLAPGELLRRLDHRLALLTSGARDLPDRHQTLRATIDWSYQLLDQQEQQLFDYLAVFAGGWTLEAAEAVCGPDAQRGEFGSWSILDGLASLIDKNLVFQQPTPQPEPSFAMLETIREYALERLSTHDLDVIERVRRRHAGFYVELAEAAETELQGARQAEWLDRLDAAHNNLRAALAWCRSDEGDPRLGIRLAGALWRFWETRGYLQEGRAAAEDMLARIGDVEVAARAKALRGAGYLAWLQGDTEIAYARLAESATLERSRDHRHGLAQTLNLIGHIATKQQDYGRAISSLEEALAIGRALRDDHLVDTALNSLGNIAAFQADYEVARRYYHEALQLRRRTGDIRGLAVTLNHLGEILRWQGDLHQAVQLYE
ncbi:MAG TPA: BTAD domain-containing putative transcriptional regulator, partial [Herpetosiphonaceae bacterium]